MASTSSTPSVADRLRADEGPTITLPLGHVTVKLPPLKHAAYYAGVAALAAAEIIEWPIALVIAAGHALAHSHNQVIEGLGESAQDA